MKLALAALLLTACATAPEPAPTSSALNAYCYPACTAAQRCVQLNSPPGHILPPVCVPR